MEMSKLNEQLDELRKTDLGQSLVKQAKADAANFLFDLESGDKNIDVASALSAETIYDAVLLSGSLTITVDGETHHLESYYPSMDEDMALELLQDAQASTENSLLKAALKRKQLQFAIYVDGGRVDSVFCRDAEGFDSEFMIYDYDIEDLLDNQVTEITQVRGKEAGTKVGAYVYRQGVDQNPTINLDDVFGAE